MSKTNNLPMEQEEVEVAEQAPVQKVTGFRVSSILLFLIAVGGLFLGVISFFRPEIITTLSGKMSALDGSLLVVIWAATFGKFLPSFADSKLVINVNSTGALNTIAQYVPYALVAGIVIALICVIVGLCSKKAARRCMFVTFYSIFFSFFAYFAFLFVAQSMCGAALADWKSYVDLSSGAVAVVALLFILFATMATKKTVSTEDAYGEIVEEKKSRKGISFVNFILVLLTLGTTFALAFPGSVTATELYWFSPASPMFSIMTIVELITWILLLVIATLTVVNFLISTIRLGSAKGMLASVTMFAVTFLAAVAVVILNIINVYANDWAQLLKLATLVLLIVTLAAFLVSLFTYIYCACKRRKAAEAEEEYDETQYEEYEEPVEEAVEEEVAPAPVAEPAPAPAPVAPVPAPAAPYLGAPVVNYIMPAPGYMPMYGAPAPAPAPAAAPAPAPAPAPAAPVSVEMTEFEKSMAALAKGETPAPAPAPAAAPAPTPAPAFRAPAPAPAPAPVAADNRYTYDPFIYTLTDAEKNEFGDLFIAGQNNARDSLPTYIIGGDNREFFSKVFIYMGRFRSQISSELLAKIYQHVIR